MLFASAATGVRQGDVAGFPAIRTIVQTVSAHAHVVLAFADGAVLFAGALLFRLVAHHAKDGTGHGSLQTKLYLTMATRGKARLRPVPPVTNLLPQIRRRLARNISARILAQAKIWLARGFFDGFKLAC
jgi:hypothetical protein